MSVVHQVVPVLEPADAIGDEVRAIRHGLRQRGFKSSVYALMQRPGGVDDVAGLAELFSEPAPAAVIYHYAVSSGATRRLATANFPLILVYHNITPASFFEGIDMAHYAACAAADHELPSLRGRAQLALADSDFSKRKLVAQGFHPTGVLPIPVDPRPFREHRPGPLCAEMRRRPTLLTVGRLVPNKCIEDVVRLLHAYRRGVDPGARLWVAGDDSRIPRYRAALRQLVHSLGETENVRWLGRVSRDDLLDLYCGAYAYVSMSEHEGFGVPLLEAMLSELPVLAYDRTAVGETLGHAGTLVPIKDFTLIAELLGRLRLSAERRRQAKLGRLRAAELSPDIVLDRLVAHLAQLGARPDPTS